VLPAGVTQGAGAESLRLLHGRKPETTFEGRRPTGISVERKGNEKDEIGFLSAMGAQPGKVNLKKKTIFRWDGAFLGWCGSTASC